MKFLFLILVSLSFHFSSANTISNQNEDPTNACHDGCTPWMQSILNGFENQATTLELTPAIYSGECRHLSHNYDPDRTDFAAIMIDKNATDDTYYFSTIFTFYADENDFKNWNLAEARKNMSPYWKENGKIKRGRVTSRVEIPYPDGSPAYIYWVRQNPITDDLYYITFAGHVMKSFCLLHKHQQMKSSVI
jgi:hypothetical protein